MREIEPRLLRELVTCNAATGEIFWLPRSEAHFSDGGHSARHNAKKWNGQYAGKPAFTKNMNGYKYGVLFYRTYGAHRIIFAYFHDYFPPVIDHIDGDKGNNQLANLRAATVSQNGCNRHLKKQSASSRFRGVHFCNTIQMYVAKLHVNGRSKYLGKFDCEVDAAKAYDHAALQNFGDFASPNFPEVAS